MDIRPLLRRTEMLYFRTRLSRLFAELMSLNARHLYESGIRDVTGNYQVCENRDTAIRMGIEKLQKGDILLLAGKGHETYQEIHGIRHPFSDAEVANRYLNNDAI